MIKSTVSGGTLVTTSASDAKSTRQRGVKHSITKRFTHRARWEVRLTSHEPRRAPDASSGVDVHRRTAGGAGVSRCGPQQGYDNRKLAENHRSADRPAPRAPLGAPSCATVVLRLGVRWESALCRACPARSPRRPPHHRRPRPDLAGEAPGRGTEVRPRGAPVRPTVPRVGGMALHSWPCSGILLGTRGTGDPVRTRCACAGGPHGRTLERVGREVANWPKPAAAAARPARTVLSAARRTSAALAENPHHGRS